MQTHLPSWIKCLFFALGLLILPNAQATDQSVIFYDGFEGGTNLAARNWLLIDAKNPDHPDPEVMWGIAGVVGKTSKGANVFFGGEAARSGTNSIYCARKGYEGTEANPIYPNNLMVHVVRTNIDLRGYVGATLSFWYKVKIPDAFAVSQWAMDVDLLRVYIEEEEEEDETPLPGGLETYSTETLDYKVVPWTRVSIPIDESFWGKMVTISFEFLSDGDNSPFNSSSDGWEDGNPDLGIPVTEQEFEGVYIDDVMVTGYKTKYLPDHNADGLTDIVMQDGKGRIATWLVDQTNLLGSFVLREGKGAPGWRLAGHNDFDTNGCTDLLFQRGDGAMAIWYFTNLTAETTNLVTVITNTPLLSTNFNTSNRITFKINNSTGGISHRYTTNATIITTNFVVTTNLTVYTNARTYTPNVTNANRTLKVVNTTNKYTFRTTNQIVTTHFWVTNQVTSPTNNYLTLTNFTTVKSNFITTKFSYRTRPYDPTNNKPVLATRPYYVRAASLKSSTKAWQLVSLADMDNDGQRDFIFQGSDRRLAWWRMQGANIVGSGLVASGKLASSGYRLVGIADFTGDGQKDLLFRRSTDGDLQLWVMSGLRFVSIRTINTASIVNRNTLSFWKIVQVADMNDDGQPDLMAQHTDGRIAIWYINANCIATRMGLVHKGAKATGWTVSGPR